MAALTIVQVSGFYESHGGGIEIVAGALARALADRGHHCRWAAAAIDAPPPDAGGVTALPLAAADPVERLTGLPMPILTPGSAAALVRAVRDADAVIIHDALYLPSLIAAWAARRYAKPWVLIQHVGSIGYPQWHLRGLMALANRLVTRPLLRAAPQSVFISDTVRRELAVGGYSRPPLLLFNGVDHALFRPGNAEARAAARAELGIADDAELLLFVGRFVDKKGLPVLRALMAGRPDARLLMAGSGPIDPAAWGLANVMVLGRCDRARLAMLYHAADALVLPSVGEGYPLVVQEAMASGLPVVCGADSALADPGAANFLYGADIDLADLAGSAVRVAAALTRALASTADQRRNAACHARTAYDWAANAARLDAAITGLRSWSADQLATARSSR